MTWSIRNFLATHNMLAVSANRREPAINTEQELDTTFLVDLNTVLNYQALKVTNREELTGKEEADRLYDQGGKVAGTLGFSRAQPQHFAFLLAYGLGQVDTAPLGAGGFRHTIRPQTGEVDTSPIQSIFYRGHAFRATSAQTALCLLFRRSGAGGVSQGRLGQDQRDCKRQRQGKRQCPNGGSLRRP